MILDSGVLLMMLMVWIQIVRKFQCVFVVRRYVNFQMFPTIIIIKHIHCFHLNVFQPFIPMVDNDDQMRWNLWFINEMISWSFRGAMRDAFPETRLHSAGFKAHHKFTIIIMIMKGNWFRSFGMLCILLPLFEWWIQFSLPWANEWDICDTMNSIYGMKEKRKECSKWKDSINSRFEMNVCLSAVRVQCSANFVCEEAVYNVHSCIILIKNEILIKTHLSLRRKHFLPFIFHALCVCVCVWHCSCIRPNDG